MELLTLTVEQNVSISIVDRGPGHCSFVFGVWGVSQGLQMYCRHGSSSHMAGI